MAIEEINVGIRSGTTRSKGSYLKQCPRSRGWEEINE